MVPITSTANMMGYDEVQRLCGSLILVVTGTSHHRKTEKPSQIRRERGKHHSQHLAAVSRGKQTKIL